MLRRMLITLLASASIATGAFPARSEQWPDGPAKVIVPYAPDDASDILARPWAELLSKALNQHFVVENRGGASGMIGAEAVYKSAPDGYTVLFTPSAVLSVLPQLRKTDYDPLKFTPVAMTGNIISGFVIHPSIGAKTFQQMIDDAKTNPGKLVYGSAGLGTAIAVKLNETIVEIAKTDDMKARMRGGLNTEVPLDTPAEVRTYFAKDTAANAAIIKAANIKLD